MITNNMYSYFVRIEIAAQNVLMLIQNYKPIPRKIIDEIAKKRIEKHINEQYTTHKYYQSQTIEQFFNKQIKQSNYEIEDLNNIEYYNLKIQFDNDENIINNVSNKHKTKTIESKINHDEQRV